MSKTILVVDDTENLRTLVKSYLTQEGFRVLTAADGREALFLARDEKPDLILLDLMMPEMGGYEFMRVYGREAETPTIILTAKVDENDKVLGLELGADDYVTKPFKRDAILMSLERAFELIGCRGVRSIPGRCFAGGLVVVVDGVGHSRGSSSPSEKGGYLSTIMNRYAAVRRPQR